MKTSSYYARKAAACRELGRWSHADEWAALAKKARRIAKNTREAKARMATLESPAFVQQFRLLS